MPSLAKRSCSTPGCRNTTANGSRCSTCERQHKGSSTERGYDSAHQRLRILSFQRDEWRCVDCGWRPQIVVDCEQYGIDQPPADVILDELRRAYHRGERHLHGDHIVPFENHPGKRLDLDNYATRCNVCHKFKTEQGDIEQPNTVTLVCGPPGSGKTTYVNQHRQAADIVFDFDAVMSALTGAQPHQTPRHAVRYVRAMRDAFYEECRHQRGNRIWIIEACPTKAERQRFAVTMHASIIFLDASEQACIDRVRSRGDEWPDIVRKWFKDKD